VATPRCKTPCGDAGIPCERLRRAAPDMRNSID
jgi:hypothetical protein